MRAEISAICSSVKLFSTGLKSDFECKGEAVRGFETVEQPDIRDRRLVRAPNCPNEGFRNEAVGYDEREIPNDRLKLRWSKGGASARSRSRSRNGIEINLGSYRSGRRVEASCSSLGEALRTERRGFWALGEEPPSAPGATLARHREQSGARRSALPGLRAARQLPLLHQKRRMAEHDRFAIPSVAVLRKE